MHAELLTKLFGANQEWHGPCTVILDAEASVQTAGADSIQSGGAKLYAPRSVSGRIAADAACLLPEAKALVIVQQQRIRQSTGEEVVKATVGILDPARIVAVEFAGTDHLATLGLPMPIAKTSGSGPGTQALVRKKTM